MPVVENLLFASLVFNLSACMYKCQMLISVHHALFQASFVASGNRTDISLDDPNFWDKWAKKAEIDLDTVNGRVSARWRPC